MGEGAREIKVRRRLICTMRVRERERERERDLREMREGARFDVPWMDGLLRSRPVWW